MSRYISAPYRFAVDGNRVYLSSDSGDFCTINHREFELLIENPDRLSMDTLQELLARNILTYCDSIDDHVAVLAARYRTRKAHLLRKSSLHMVVPTIACNCKCLYCQVAGSSDNDKYGFMTRDTADRIVGLIAEFPGTIKKVEFQGGEPLLHFEMVRYLTGQLLEATGTNSLSKLEFVLCTNLHALSPDHLTFLQQHQFAISTSFDGPSDLHDALRPTKVGGCSYEIFRERLRVAREALGVENVSALLTITRHSLGRIEEIADAYRELGCHSICLRRLNRYGRADRHYEDLGYTDIEYVECFTRGLHRILAFNREGFLMVEEFTAMIARRLLMSFGDCHLDMLSPAGGGIVGALYNYDGRVYLSDEGRMVGEEGDDRYCLGTVKEGSYAALFLSERARTFASEGTLECRPGCCDCVFLPFCGVETVERGNAPRGVSAARPLCIERSRCWKYQLFVHVVRLLADPTAREILERWAYA